MNECLNCKGRRKGRSVSTRAAAAATVRTTAKNTDRTDLIVLVWLQRFVMML